MKETKLRDFLLQLDSDFCFQNMKVEELQPVKNVIEKTKKNANTT